MYHSIVFIAKYKCLHPAIEEYAESRQDHCFDKDKRRAHYSKGFVLDQIGPAREIRWSAIVISARLSLGLIFQRATVIVGSRSHYVDHIRPHAYPQHRGQPTNYNVGAS